MTSGKPGKIFFFISERIFLALFDSQRGFIHLQDPRVISLFSLSHSLIYWIRFFFYRL